MSDVDKLIAFSQDLGDFLRDKKDINQLKQCFDQSASFQSSIHSHFERVQGLIQDYEKKISSSMDKIDEVKSKVVSDEKLDLLQKELEAELQRDRLLKEELRKLADELNDLEFQKSSIEERKQMQRRLKKDTLKEQRKLSMYASVTNIIPNLDNEFKVTGHIVDMNKKVVEKLEFDLTNVSEFELCNRIWEMIGPREPA